MKDLPQKLIEVNVEELACENRGLAEALYVLQEYLKETENKKEIDSVIVRLIQRFNWTIYNLKEANPPADLKWINPDDDFKKPSLIPEASNSHTDKA